MNVDHDRYLSIFKNFSSTIFGTGEVKTAFTDLRDIGKFVARIIADPRTLNRYVFVYSEELTQKEVLEIAKEASGQEFPVTYMSAKELEEEALGNPNEHPYLKFGRAYMKSMWILGDNTIENAKKEEYGSALDARALYPDLEANTLRSFAKEFYKQSK